MSLLGVMRWIAATPWSVALRESIFAYPIIESIHVLGICLFVGISAMWDLRLLGVGFARTYVTDAAERLVPWMRAGFALMMISGVITFLNDPVRYYNNIFFRVKMIMLVLAGVNAWIFHATVFRSVTQWDARTRPPLGARLAGAASLLLWALIITAGRMIAYNWFDKSR
ncbi:MAG: putative rane protein [Acidobacteria bacterium]|nr:putative rane protein [Acidobacteriota bacterium]